MTEERTVLAGGCFWGMQDLIRRYDGVISTRVGYSGGDVPNATYRNHGTHAEALEIVFDPTKISYRRLLELFFQIHDPTTRNRQGDDVGTSYRSAIFYTSDEQKRIAEVTIADVEASGLWPGEVVTEVSPAGPFWEAEPEHQDYLEKNPNGYTCHLIRPDWKLPARKDADRVRVERRRGVNSESATTMGPYEGVMLTYCLDWRDFPGLAAASRSSGLSACDCLRRFCLGRKSDCRFCARCAGDPLWHRLPRHGRVLCPYLSQGSRHTGYVGKYGLHRWPPHSPVRVIANSLTDELGQRLLRHKPQDIPREVIAKEYGRPIYRYSTDSPLKITTGDLECLALFAEQIAGAIEAIPSAGARVGEIVSEVHATLDRLRRLETATA